MSKDNN